MNQGEAPSTEPAAKPAVLDHVSPADEAVPSRLGILPVAALVLGVASCPCVIVAIQRVVPVHLPWLPPPARFLTPAIASLFLGVAATVRARGSDRRGLLFSIAGAALSLLWLLLYFVVSAAFDGIRFGPGD